MAKRMDEDLVRKAIQSALDSRGESWRWLSLEMGRNHAYIEQYMHRKKPKKLSYDDKLKVRNILGVPLPRLGIIVPADAGPSPSATALNILADAERYVAPPNKPYGALASHPNVGLYRAKTPALDRHRLHIGVGDLLLVKLPGDTRVALEPNEAYLINLYDKQAPLVTTIIRQHVEPKLLITNSSALHHILSIDQNNLPFEIIVEGKIDSVIRNSEKF